jgi:hypothetical protein
MNPWHRTPAFWLAAIAAAYCAGAGSLATLTPALLDAVPMPVKALLGTLGFLLPAAAAFAKIVEAPRQPAPPKPPASNDFHQGETP